MSLATIIGLFFSMGLFLSAIALNTDNYAIFLSASSFLMVVGGTLGATFISYEPRYVILSLRLLYKIFFTAKIGRNLLKTEVGRIIKWAYTVQKKGLPALESESKKSVRGDRFLKYGIDMVVSGYTGEEVREILTNLINTTYGRNTIQVKILRNMGAAAPAFGMVGTLIGLVIMLDSMGGDPSALGAGLAVALMTTLYGVIFARLFLLPVADKVQQREQIVRFRNILLCEGLSLLAERRSPRYIQDKMNSYLDPSLHFNIDKMRR